jgi:predicted ATPase/transcriptional regulator with XRE-family HTH domain
MSAITPVEQERLREQLESARDDIRRRRSEMEAEAGRVLRSWRTARKINQDTLAAQACMTDAVVRRVEKGDYGATPEPLIEAVRGLGGPFRELREFAQRVRQLQADQKQIDKLLTRKTLPDTIAILADGEVAVAGRIKPAVVPRPPALFVGRRHELSTLEGLLSHGRLVTVTGPGGIGKTALCLHFAHTQPVVLAGPWFVDLSAIGPGEPVLPMVARLILDEDEDCAELADDDEAATVLGAAIGGVAALVVFDNCEHLLAETVRAVTRLLDACPGVRVLATSREPLHLPDESVMTLGPLSVPGDQGPVRDETKADTGEAVELFTLLLGKARGDTVGLRPQDAVTVADLCRQLDGIPLCIELAAARARTLSLSDIADSVGRSLAVLSGGRRDRPRHQAIEATIGWSWDLLAADEQRALSRLSTLAVPFTFGCGAAMASDDEASAERLVAALADKSLLSQEVDEAGDSRLRILQVVRSFAAGRLSDADRTDAVRGLMSWALKQMQYDELELQRPDVVERITAHLPVIRAALEQSEDTPADQVRLALAIWVYWMVASMLSYGCQFLAKALDDGIGLTPFERGRALGALAELLRNQWDFTAAIEASRKSIEIRRGLNDPVQLRYALIGLLGTLLSAVRVDDAEQCLAEIDEIPGEMHESSLADLNITRAIYCAFRNDAQRSVQLLLDTLQIFERANLQVGATVGLHQLSSAYRITGDFEGSLRAAIEGDQLYGDEMGHRFRDVITLDLAASYQALGRHQEALDVLDSRPLEDPSLSTMRAHMLALRAMAASAAAPSAAAALLLQHPDEFAESPLQLIMAAGEIAFQHGAYESAALLLGVHESLWREVPQIEVGPPGLGLRSGLAAKLPDAELGTLIAQGAEIDAGHAVDFGTGILKELAATADLTS